jgi:hypothetical protein
LYFLFRNLKRFGVSLEEALEYLVKALESVKMGVAKPVVFALTRDSDEIDAEEFRLTLKQRLLEVGVPAFDSVRAACLVLSRLEQFRKTRERISGGPA